MCVGGWGFRRPFPFDSEKPRTPKFLIFSTTNQAHQFFSLTLAEERTDASRINRKAEMKSCGQGWRLCTGLPPNVQAPGVTHVTLSLDTTQKNTERKGGEKSKYQRSGALISNERSLKSLPRPGSEVKAQTEKNRTLK